MSTKTKAGRPATTRARIHAYLAEHPTASIREVCQAVNTNTGSNNCRIIKDWKSKTFTQVSPASPEESREFQGDSGIISTRRANIRTLEELLDYMDVDLEVWEVERHIINKWEVGAKDESKQVQVTPLYQVKAWLKRKVAVVKAREAFTDMLAAFRSAAPKLRCVKAPAAGCLFEVDIFDPHFGKLCWAKESGRDYDLKIAATEYARAIEGLIARTAGHKIERILYPIGNDFFHTDTGNFTTAGTEQDCDGRWQKSFIEGRAAVMRSIARLRELAPVDVLMIPGNHDTHKVFYLGEVLQGWFSRTANVKIDNTPQMRKYYRYGATLLGFTHGNNEKHADLPLIMANEAAKDWAETKFREVHVGHHHHEKTISFQPTKEFHTVRVRWLSSLTPQDAWHRKMGYEGLRAANGFLWDRHDGCVATLSFNA